MVTSKQLNTLNKITIFIYVLQLISLFTAIPMFIAVIINYVRYKDVKGTWYESHFRWQMNTFWYGLLFYFVGVCLHFYIIGFVIMAITWFWQLYRILKGCITFSEHHPMYE